MRRVLAGVLLAVPAWGQLPEAMAPPGNPITRDKVRLGKALFWEEQLSAHDGVACGTCHRPSAGGSDPRVETHAGPDGEFGTDDDRFGSPGTPGRVTPRRPRSVIAASYGFELFWDGRAAERFVDPLFHSNRLCCDNSSIQCDGDDRGTATPATFVVLDVIR